VRDLWPAGRVQVGFAKGRGHRLLDLWLNHLALNCAAPARHPRASHLVARTGKDGQPAVITFRAVDRARELLAQLIEIYLLGQRVPLPLFKEASWAYADAWAGGNALKADKDARVRYLGGFGARGDAEDPYVAQVFADLDPLARGFCLVPLDGVAVPDFATLAERVYGPLLEQLGEDEA